MYVFGRAARNQVAALFVCCGASVFVVLLISTWHMLQTGFALPIWAILGLPYLFGPYLFGPYLFGPYLFDLT
jgi:hypothetical protein